LGFDTQADKKSTPIRHMEWYRRLIVSSMLAFIVKPEINKIIQNTHLSYLEIIDRFVTETITIQK
jgi:hypothetical protein